jgi:arsenite-transporting ATPase
MELLQKEFSHLRRHPIPQLAGEIRGLDKLRAFGGTLWSGKAVIVEERDPRSSTVNIQAPRTPFPSTLRSVFVIGGKGGVGKTTTAAALALSLTKAHPHRRFLIVSTDPAHSLSDSVGEHIGPFKSSVAGRLNLDRIDIEATGTFEQLKDRYRRWIDEIFLVMTGGNWRVEFDREAMHELIALAPPGMDEIAALSTISRFLDDESYASIVLDTAPTGHLLRFLQLPEVALQWVRTFIKLLLKYRAVVTSSNVGEELVSLSRSIKRVLGVLKNNESTEVIGVAIPEQMSLAETIDMAVSLRAMSISFAHVVINNVIPEAAAERCAFCADRRSRQMRYVGEFRKAFQANARILISPQLPGEVSGVPRLQEFWAAVGELVRPKARGKGEA